MNILSRTRNGLGQFCEYLLDYVGLRPTDVLARLWSLFGVCVLIVE